MGAYNERTIYNPNTGRWITGTEVPKIRGQVQGDWNRNVGSYTVPWNGNTFGRSTETSSPTTETETTNAAQPTKETASNSRTYTSRMNVGVQRPYTSAMRSKAQEYGLTDANTVKRLQTWLYNNGQYTKPYNSVEAAADGIYGSNTNAAVLNWLSANQDKSFTDLMNLVNGIKSETPSNNVTSEPISTIASLYNWNQSAPEYRLDSFTPRGNLSHYYSDNTFVGLFNKQQGMNMHRLGQNYIDRNGVTHNMGEMRRGQIRRLARRERRADINALNNLQAYNEMANLPNYGESTQPAQSNNQVQVNPTTGISTQFDSLMNNYYKTRGYQQGGKMNDKQLQEAFIQFLAQKSGAKNEKELEAYVKQLGEDGLKQAYAEFTEVMQKQTQKAKQGAKLNYIKQLKHQCPEGYEVTYFKEGGIVKCNCEKKMEKGGEAPKLTGVARFKKEKIAKHQYGGITQRPTNKLDIVDAVNIVGPIAIPYYNTYEAVKELKQNPSTANVLNTTKTIVDDTIGLTPGVGAGNKLSNYIKSIKRLKGFIDKNKSTQPTQLSSQQPQYKKITVVNPSVVNKLDPKTTKILPDGKYPKNWTTADRALWESVYGDNEQVEGINRGIGKNKCGGKLKKKAEKGTKITVSACGSKMKKK